MFPRLRRPLENWFILSLYILTKEKDNTIPHFYYKYYTLYDNIFIALLVFYMFVRQTLRTSDRTANFHGIYCVLSFVHPTNIYALVFTIIYHQSECIAKFQVELCSKFYTIRVNALQSFKSSCVQNSIENIILTLYLK